MRAAVSTPRSARISTSSISADRRGVELALGDQVGDRAAERRRACACSPPVRRCHQPPLFVRCLAHVLLPSLGARDSGFGQVGNDDPRRDGGAPALSRRADAGDRQAGRASRCIAGRRAARAWRIISTRCASGCRARRRSRTGSTATPPAASCSAAIARRWRELGKLFKIRRVGKTYWAVVEGAPATDEGTHRPAARPARRNARLVDEARSARPAGGDDVESAGPRSPPAFWGSE